MTLEKTLFLSVLLHAVILSALTVAFKKPLIIPKPFDVELVSSDEGQPKAAVEVKNTPSQVAVKPQSAPVVEKKPAMPAVKTAPEKKSSRPSREEEDLVKEALANVQEKTIINNGMNLVENRVKKLKGKLIITKKQKSAKTAGGAGLAGSGANSQLGAYENKLVQCIKRHWIFPDQKTHGIEGTITIEVLKDGTVNYKDFDKRSGNALFDSSVVRAVQMTGKCMPPPDGIAPADIGVVFSPD